MSTWFKWHFYEKRVKHSESYLYMKELANFYFLVSDAPAVFKMISYKFVFVT